jgi:hypothetical protein
MDNLLFRSRYLLRGCCDKGLQYLKPNFGAHPLNYFFVIAFFFVGFFPAQAFAANSYYSYHTGSGADRAVGADQSSACSNWGGHWVDGVQCWANSDKSGGSPVGYWNYCYAPTPFFVSTTAPYCSAVNEPPPSTCTKDEYKLISYKTVSTSSGADTGGISITPKPTSFGDCVYTTTGIALNDDYPDPDYSDSDVQCYEETEGSTDVTCYHTTWMQNTGNSPQPDAEVTEAEDLP